MAKATTPTTTILPWNSQNGNVTSVGTNGGPSAYGTFDMSGNVNEWNDLTGAAGSSMGQRGGSWKDPAVYLSSSYDGHIDSWYDSNGIGFRLAAVPELGIPEPSSLSLLLAGGAVLMAGRRRKQD